MYCVEIKHRRQLNYSSSLEKSSSKCRQEPDTELVCRRRPKESSSKLSSRTRHRIHPELFCRRRLRESPPKLSSKTRHRINPKLVVVKNRHRICRRQESTPN